MIKTDNSCSSVSENIEDEDAIENCKYLNCFFIDCNLINSGVVDGPKKPREELSTCKVITAAASNYIAQEFNFSPDNNSNKFKVLDNH